MAMEIRLPQLGDGIESADILEVLVKEGDAVSEDQGVVEIETDKATVQVPAGRAGTVAKVHVTPGQSIRIGTLLVTMESPASVAPSATIPAPSADCPAAARVEAAVRKPSPASSNAPAPLHRPAEPPSSAGPTPSSPPPKAARHETPVAQATGNPLPGPQPPAAAADTRPIVPAGPAVRRFARELGVDLRRVTGTGAGGRITRDDLLAVVRSDTRAASKSAAPGSTRDAWGVVRIERLSKVRRTIAEKMRASWSQVARVTNFDDADVTELEQIRQASKGDYAKIGIKLTTLPFALKAVAMALKAHPTINASIDIENDQLILKEYVHLGIAVDTDRGLIVPVLRDADALSISEIARGVGALSERVRGGEFSVEDLRGGTFTVSNLGAVGGTYSTPIVNVPEVAILLLGKSRQMPVVRHDAIVRRLMMPLSLSYDHRLVDGAAAARFLNDVIGYLENPSRLLLVP